MFRKLTIAVLLVTTGATTGQAQIVGPPIAYGKVSGSAHEIHLVNPDGSGARLVHRSPNKVGIGFMDIRPGGGQIAFSQGTTGLNILAYNGSGVPAPPAQRIDPGCFVEGIDWHPDGGSILYSSSCNQIGQVKVYVPGQNPQPLFNSSLTSVRWGRDGDSVFYMKPAGASRNLVWRQLSTGREVVLYSTAGFTTFDVGRTTNSILLANNSANILKIDFPPAFPAEGETPAFTVTQIERGTSPHFSPNDTEFLFETPHSSSGDYLLVNQANGTDIRIAPKGSYGQSDWAPPAL